jgi:hypothetical protein
LTVAIFSVSADTVARRYWEHRHGLEPGSIQWLIALEVSRQANPGLLTDDEVWEWVLAPLGLDRATREAAANDYWAGSHLDYGMIGLIERVHEAGYRTALLSNVWLSARASHIALG